MYRQTPFILEAAKTDDLETVKLLQKRNADIHERGHFCFSPVYKNSVQSNIVATAAFFAGGLLSTWVLTFLIF